MTAIVEAQARRPIAPIKEESDAYLTHQQAVIADLAPAGPVEALYADRIAHLMWRMQQLRRYEAHQLTKPRQAYEDAFDAGLEKVEEDVQDYWKRRVAGDLKSLGISAEEAPKYLSQYSSVLELQYEHIKNKEQRVKLLERVKGMPDDELWPFDEYPSDALFDVAKYADIDEEAYGKLFDLLPDDDEDWTIGHVRRFMEFVVSNTSKLDDYDYDDDDDDDESNEWDELIFGAYYHDVDRNVVHIGDSLARVRQHLIESLSKKLRPLERKAQSVFSLADVLDTVELFNFQQDERVIMRDINEAMSKLEQLKAKRQSQGARLPTVTISPAIAPILLAN